MPLFIVRHQHAADGCPAQDPFMGASLLNHLSRPNLRRFGLQIQGEAVVQGAHTMYMIVEAADEDRLREFMQPFQMAGSLDIYPASTCVRVVASGGCAAPVPASAGVPTVDPEEACQQAIAADMVVHRAHPLNCETSIWALVGSVVMPNTRFYMRNNFGMPNLDPATFRLAIGGLVERPQSFAVRDLQNLRSKTQVVTLDAPATGERCSIARPRERNGDWAPSARRNGPVCRSSRSSTAPACGRKGRTCCFAALTAGPWTAARNPSASSAVFGSTTRATAMCSWPTP